MQDPKQNPFAIQAIRYLFYLCAAIWVVFGIINIIRFGFASSTMLLIITLMFSNAAVMYFSGLWLRYQNKWGYLFAAGILGLNILLTITDQFGIFDLITLALYLLLAGLMIGAWRWYWRQPVPVAKSKK